MAALAVAGVGLMVVCSSSLAAVMMMGGEEETPATTTTAGPSGPARDLRHLMIPASHQNNH
jgi:hypothetical protein